MHAGAEILHSNQAQTKGRNFCAPESHPELKDQKRLLKQAQELISQLPGSSNFSVTYQTDSKYLPVRAKAGEIVIAQNIQDNNGSHIKLYGPECYAGSTDAQEILTMSFANESIRAALAAQLDQAPETIKSQVKNICSLIIHSPQGILRRLPDTEPEKHMWQSLIYDALHIQTDKKENWDKIFKYALVGSYGLSVEQADSIIYLLKCFFKSLPGKSCPAEISCRLKGSETHLKTYIRSKQLSRIFDENLHDNSLRKVFLSIFEKPKA